MRKSRILRIIIPLFILITIISSVFLYFTQTYLYLPFTVPAAITKEQSFTYEWFKKPVAVEVMTDEDIDNEPLVRCVYFPKDKTQYEKLAYKMADFYADIISKGTKVSFEAYDYEMQNSNMSGIRYVINLRCVESVMLKMDFVDCNETIQMGNDFYTITPELRDQLLDYVRETYVIKEDIT